MKRAATIVVVLMLAACSSLPPARGGGERPPGLTLELLKVDDTPTGQIEATLRLDNGSSRPFSFRGYSLQRPVGGTEVRHHLRWRSVVLAACGTGLMTVTLNPGQSTVLTVPLWVREPGRTYDVARVAIWDADGSFAVRSVPIRVHAGWAKPITLPAGSRTKISVAPYGATRRGTTISASFGTRAATASKSSTSM